jgi:hypothetical protein
MAKKWASYGLFHLPKTHTGRALCVGIFPQPTIYEYGAGGLLQCNHHMSSSSPMAAAEISRCTARSSAWHFDGSVVGAHMRYSTFPRGRAYQV